MQMCPNCDRVYDESEYSRCPYCHPYDEDDGRERTVIVYDRDEGRAKYVPESEAEKYCPRDVYCLDFLIVLFADCLCTAQVVIDIPRLDMELVRNLVD